MSIIYFYKAAGVIIVTFIGIYITREYSRSVRGEIAAARDAERLLRYIGECITYRGDTVGEIIGSYDCGCDLTGEVWKCAAQTTLTEALTVSRPPFDAKTRSILLEFASLLGRGYREPQAELCRRTAEKLAEHITSLEASKSDRLKVSSAVSVFICLSLIILLI